MEKHKSSEKIFLLLKSTFLFFVLIFLSSCDSETSQEPTPDYRTQYLGDFEFRVYTRYGQANFNPVYDSSVFSGFVKIFDPADSLADISDDDFMDYYDDPRISIAFASDTIISPSISSNGQLQGVRQDAYVEGSLVTADSLYISLIIEEPNFWVRRFSIIGVRK
jgi:hypothetical protein